MCILSKNDSLASKMEDAKNNFLKNVEDSNAEREKEILADPETDTYIGTPEGHVDYIKNKNITKAIEAGASPTVMSAQQSQHSLASRRRKLIESYKNNISSRLGRNTVNNSKLNKVGLYQQMNGKA